jgi:protein involved in polysaccharide export with SLBB domain
MTVNVWGEVRSPGAHQIPWNADLVAALSAAGGPTSQADLRDVRIVYRDFQSEYDLRAYLDGHGSTVPLMEPGVTVFIGRSGYEWWKEAVDFAYKIIVAVNVILVVTR